jgi:hypothetical protein
MAYIARRLQAIREIAAEKNEQPRSGELARLFQIMCARATLHGGDLSTSEMRLLPSELIPDATARLQEPERLAA